MSASRTSVWLSGCHVGRRWRLHVSTMINVLVGQEDIRYTVGLGTTLPDGAEISIFDAVSGGSGPAT
jgi:molybdopterin converting factor small subunit